MVKKDFKLIGFDVDGTLTAGLSWERFHALAGITHDENETLVEKYYKHEITTAQWMEYLTVKYKQSGISRAEIEAISAEIPFMSGAQETVAKIKEKYPVCLVSSGIDLFVKKVAKVLGIETWHANSEFTFDANDTVTGVRLKGPEEKGKVGYLTMVCKKRGIRAEEIVFVGDGMNDLPAFIFTKHGILVGKGNEQLKKGAWKHAEEISAIVPMLT